MENIAEISNYSQTFEDLNVYKKAYSLSLEIHKISKEFPKDELYALTSQIRRASKSICANIAEGYVKRGQSNKEFSRFLSIAIGSSGEMLVWSQYCYDLEFIKEETNNRWKQEYQIIIRMLQKLRSSLIKP